MGLSPRAAPFRFESFPEPVSAVVNGASRGIGLAMARLLAGSPSVSRTFATCRNPAESAALLDLARSADVEVLPVDVEDEPTVQAGAERIAREVGEVQLVVNCFGVLHSGEYMRPEKRLADVDPEALARSFAINATGHLLAAKHFTPLLPTRGRAVFASLSARVGSIDDNRLGGWYAYRASKAAQNMITKTLSIELARRRPDTVCLALHPGTTATDLSEPFTRASTRDRLFSPERAARQLLSVIDSSEQARTGDFLAWDASPIPW